MTRSELSIITGQLSWLKSLLPVANQKAASKHLVQELKSRFPVGVCVLILVLQFLLFEFIFQGYFVMTSHVVNGFSYFQLLIYYDFIGQLFYITIHLSR